MERCALSPCVYQSGHVKATVSPVNAVVIASSVIFRAVARSPVSIPRASSRPVKSGMKDAAASPIKHVTRRNRWIHGWSATRESARPVLVPTGKKVVRVSRGLAMAMPWRATVSAVSRRIVRRARSAVRVEPGTCATPPAVRAKARYVARQTAALVSCFARAPRTGVARVVRRAATA